MPHARYLDRPAPAWIRALLCARDAMPAGGRLTIEATKVEAGVRLGYGIVAQTGGTIAIDSTPGSGTRVAIELPCREPAYEPRPAAGTATPGR